MRKVLLCLCGLTPQVITETIYALAELQRPAFIPDEVHVITTGTGKMLIMEKLLHPEQGRFYALCREYGLGNIHFHESTVHVVSRNGEEVFDLRDDLENNITADFILNIVRKLCSDPGSQVHASLAGGRKTMSFYLGMAMQFYARPQDELSHLLVNPPFENHPDFFYPPKAPKDYTAYDRSTGRLYSVNSRKAKIVLARIPFVRLRERLTEMDTSPVSFTRKVESAQESIAGQELPLLLMDIASLEVEFNGRKTKLTPVEAAIYAQLIKIKKRCKKRARCKHCFECYINPYDLSVEEILAFLRERWGTFSPRLDSIQKRLESRLDLREWFLQNRSRVNRKIRAIDPEERALIKAVGPYGNRVYGIGIERERIALNG
ncbi:CRISPR-associated ring nuclease Csm6 [Desulfovulcanus sp.]